MKILIPMLIVLLSLSSVFAWWDTDWVYCRNLVHYNTSVSGSENWVPKTATVSGLTCDNCTKEIRLVNDSCSGSGSPIGVHVYSESGSNPNKEVVIEYLLNYTGSNVTYALYYNNSDAPEQSFNLVKGYETSDFMSFEYNGVNVTNLTKTNLGGSLCTDDSDTNCNSIYKANFPDGTEIFNFPYGRGLGQFMEYESGYITPNGNTSMHGFDCGFNGVLCEYKVYADAGSGGQINAFTWDWKFYYGGDNSVLIWLNATQNVTSTFLSGDGTEAIDYPTIPFKIAPYHNNHLTNGNWFYATSTDTWDNDTLTTPLSLVEIQDDFYGVYNGSFVAAAINRSGPVYVIDGDDEFNVWSGDFRNDNLVSLGLKYQTVWYYFKNGGSPVDAAEMSNLLDMLSVDIMSEEEQGGTTTTTVPATTTTTIPATTTTAPATTTTAPATTTTVSVTTTLPPQGTVTNILRGIGEGIGGLFTGMSAPLAVFIILLAIGSGIGYIMSGVGKNIGGKA